MPGTDEMKLVILQSHNREQLSGWMGRCTASVKAWAAALGADYQLIHDELFDYVPADLLAKAGDQRVIATDIARLGWMKEVLNGGCHRVIWCDADLLVFRHFYPLDTSHAFGREVWVQLKNGRPRAYRKIHNAYMSFTADSPVLDFYLESATRLLTAAKMPVVPQFLGPKLLTALHNIVGFTVEERVGMLSPLALQALLAGGGIAFDMTEKGHADDLCALNLSASLEGQSNDGVCNNKQDYDVVIDLLLAKSTS